jgi:hypothetical protein
MRSQQIGFGENLAKRPRAVACLKLMSVFNNPMVLVPVVLCCSCRSRSAARRSPAATPFTIHL